MARPDEPVRDVLHRAWNRVAALGAASSMTHFIISDLHLNMGCQADGSLHPLEDFDCHDDFDQLLDLACRERASLVINGDWLDLLQLDPVVPIVAYQSTGGIPLYYTSQEALEKLDTCLKQQPRHFEALRRYLHD